jgi:hypothetical protein
VPPTTTERRGRRRRETSGQGLAVAAARTATGGRDRLSVLAGLGGTGRGSARVGGWRRHVRVGEEPEEGVISFVG